MKWLFFLLCLLNLGYLLWQFHNGRLDIQPQISSESSSLLLVSEYQRARRGAEISGLIDKQVEHQMDQWQQADMQHLLFNLTAEKRWWRMPFARPKPKKIVKPEIVKKAVEPAKPKPALPAVELKCYEVGPFSDELSAKQWLTKNALNSKQTIQKDHAVSSDYQVYYPAAKTPDQSKLDKAMLNDKGIQDVWQIPSGELKGAYSLGVFKDKQRAFVLKDELAAKGVKAQIKPRGKTITQWFVRVMLDKAKLKQYQSETLQLLACSAG